MKQILLIFTLFCASYMTMNAQTNTWTGAGANTNWSTIGNWSLNAVPTATNDVVIPTGFTVNLNVVGNTKSIVLQGNSTFNIANSLSFTNSSSFGANTTIIFSDGALSGGGTLTNNGTINFTTTASKYVYEDTVVNNLGIINFNDSGVLYFVNGTINNLATGIIDMKATGGGITTSGGVTHIINNVGLIKRSLATESVYMNIELQNNGGTIDVQTGTLVFGSGTVQLDGGVYNVAPTAALNWTSAVSCQGILTGVLNGPINWYDNVNVTTAATFNFSGTTGVQWNDGAFVGGGTLTNSNELTIVTSASKYIYGNSVLINSGTLNFEGSSILYFVDGTINNGSTGVIDLQTSGGGITTSGGTLHQIINTGLIKRTVATTVTSLAVELINNGGIITVQTGSLNFSAPTIKLNGGTYNVSSGAALNWTSTITCQGMLTGSLNGPINWEDAVNVLTATNFNFTGSTGVNWNNGSLIGGGTLTNTNKLTMLTSSSKYIYDSSTINNNGTINYEGPGILYFVNGTINNQLGATIDMRSDGTVFNTSGGVQHVLNNYGLLKRTTSSGMASIQIELNNNNGTISVQNGTLSLVGETKYLNNGVYNVTAGNHLQWNTTIVPSGTLTGILAGEILWNNIVSVPAANTATFAFTGATGINWSDGSLISGGTLINNGEITMTTSSSKYLYDGTTLNNNGFINYESNGIIYFVDGTINNQPTGIMDLTVDTGTITTSGGTVHLLNNTGLIRRKLGVGSFTIAVELHNNDGTIAVESGNLNLSGPTMYLTDGEYNVTSGTSFLWNAVIIPAGNLTGVLNGPISWVNNVNLPASTTASFDFTGITGINWVDGALVGSGILTNNGEISMTTTSSKYIYDNTVLNNNGAFNYEEGGILYFVNGTINNLATGVIDFKLDGALFNTSGGVTHVLNNAGLIKKSVGTGTISVFTDLNNSGIVTVMVGELECNALLNNTVDGVISGVGILDLPEPAIFTNNGTFSPGGVPGKLSVLGDFKSSSTSVLDVELFGLVPNTGYDVLAITGNAIFAGIVTVNLNFAPNLNDQFVVATTSGTITECSLIPTTSAEYDGMVYTFSVICQTNNQVVLKVTNITLGLEEQQFSESSIGIFPNPVRSVMTLKNVNNLELQTAEIFDVTGKIITSFNLKNMGLTKDISLENLSAGLYFVKISGLNASVVKRIVKQ